MVKPLTFKGDKKPKKRKRTDESQQPHHQVQQALIDTLGEEAIAADDTWVSADDLGDVVGPIMFVLPTTSPSSLACDASGKVFILAIENIVDGNPVSAEPHDIRQVWVANKVSGTENFRFKGHHGKYLASDKHGILSATSEAVSPLESFVLTATPEIPGTFQLQTLRNTFITLEGPTSASAGTAGSTGSKAKAATPQVRGDATNISSASPLRIRMQARFKPRIKASKEEKAREKISRKELEEAVGRRLDDDEVKRLKRARREGDFHERLLDFKVKSKHDKYG